jgi:hypothetical protein
LQSSTEAYKTLKPPTPKTLKKREIFPKFKNKIKIRMEMKN